MGHIYCSDPKLGMDVGVWVTKTMQEAFGPYPGNEFIVVLEGSFQMLDASEVGAAGHKGQRVAFRNAIPESWKQDGDFGELYVTYLNPQLPRLKISSAAGSLLPFAWHMSLTDAHKTMDGGLSRSARGID